MTEVEGAGALPVAALTADTIARIRPDATLFEVADALVAADVGALVVGEEARPVGVVSERDLAAAVAARRPFESTTALDVATRELVWCDESATVAEVAEEMCERYVRHVLVQRGGELIGVVSARDLLGAYAAADMDDEA